MTDDHLDRLETAFTQFEQALVDRWRQTIHEKVVGMDYIPPALHIYKSQRDSGIVWEHRRPEVKAHIEFGQAYGGCAYLNWYRDGCRGSVRSITCDGRIRMPGDSGAGQIEWPNPYTGGYDMVEVPETIDCGIGLIFAAAEDWAWQDRQYIFDTIPLFANQKVEVLRDARDALVTVAVTLGLVPDQDDDGDGREPGYTMDFQSEESIADKVHYLAAGETESDGWRARWTGTASDSVASGIFASVEPTRRNQATLANSIATLVNIRATIIQTYRDNTVNLVNKATDRLRERANGEVDYTNVWDAVQGIGTAIAIPPATAPYGTATILVGWLGQRLLPTRHTASFRYGPGEVAIDLYDEVLRMKEELTMSEDSLLDDAILLRRSLNQTPSWYLELYDLTENTPGDH